jgi:uncharacterized RDD family membrane protein YckC
MQSPSILRRYLSTSIDGIVILVVFIVVSFAVTSSSAFAASTRVAAFLGMFLIYEPVLTSYGCTLGQKITGIRVRKLATLQRISIPAAYLRILFKVFLGFLSLLTIPCTRDRRAIHDFISGSVVIRV